MSAECLFHYSIDDAMHHTAKCKLLQMFNLDYVAENPYRYIIFVDTDLMWQLANPTPADNVVKKLGAWIAARNTLWIKSVL